MLFQPITSRPTPFRTCNIYLCWIFLVIWQLVICLLFLFVILLFWLGYLLHVWNKSLKIRRNKMGVTVHSYLSTWISISIGLYENNMRSILFVFMNGGMVRRFACCGCKEIWVGIISIPLVKGGPVYPTLKEIRKDILVHLSLTFRSFKPLSSWPLFRYFWVISLG